MVQYKTINIMHQVYYSLFIFAIPTWYSHHWGKNMQIFKENKMFN